MRLVAEPLTEEAFAPFGSVPRAPDEPGRRDFFDATLMNLRPDAPASLSIVRGAPVAGPAVPVTVIERHAFSSQTFLPLAPVRWLVVVAPGGDAGPDLSHARAFLPAPGQGVTFAPGTWHAPLTILGEAAFAIFMWRDGGPQDEEFASIAPLEVDLPQAD